MDERLRMVLLGPPRILQGRDPVADLTQKTQALLIYLACNRRTHARSTLAGLLWGDVPDQNARLSLRVALSTLRRSLAPYLTIGRETVTFNVHSPYRLDVQLFARRIEQVLHDNGRLLPPGDAEILIRTLALYRGEFLEGMYVRNAPLFDEWLCEQREQLRRLMVRGLHRMAIHYIEREEYRFALQYSNRLLNFEPWQEEIHQQVMVLLALLGERGAVLAQYERCRRILQTEFGIEPGEKTTALYQRLLLDPRRMERLEVLVLAGARE